MSFSDLGLSPELLRAVSEKGYASSTPIQSQAIPAILAGRDVMAAAQTGTGKTAAFVLPILQRLAETETGAARKVPRALVLTPTRELAAQVADNARVYGRHLNIRTAVVFGGVGINPQIDEMRRGCDLLIATPGRLLDLADRGALSLSRIGQFVLDEADRMLDMGFIHAIRQVLKLLPPERQNLMFSATYSEDIRALAQRFLRNPQTVEVAGRNSTAERVEQSLYLVPKEHKRHLLAHLIRAGNWQQVLVFTRTKHGANRLAKQIGEAGIAAAAIHGNKSQSARVRALEDFKGCRITALVATEVAARGLDIKELPHVVNFELPNVPEDYVHRIGRTARAGAAGAAISLVSPDEAPLLRDIERLLKRAIPVAALPRFPITASAAGAAPEREERAERTSSRSAAAAGNRQADRGVNRRRAAPGRERQGGERTPGAGRQSPPGQVGRHDGGGNRQETGSVASRGHGGHIDRAVHHQGRQFSPDRRSPQRNVASGRSDGGWRRA
jgi:ATP-dependent RNA helicase RhlE